jgi:hypothetical protein
MYSLKATWYRLKDFAGDDLIVGWKLSVTMQRRTALHWLRRHGEFHEGSAHPAEEVPIDRACWMPVLKSWRQLGIDLPEVPESTMASEVGQIPVDGGDFLPFLLEYRMIVEERVGTLADLADRYPQYREVLFPPPKPKRRKRAPRLSISILDYAEIPNSTDQYNFNFEFHCTDCGGFVITAPDDEQDAVLCAACGAQYGSFAKLKATCRTIALDKMKALKLGAFRGE